ncbi:envelope protein [Triplophysa rosa]|uniref:Envelope protein n=1 Tax=Triplophysa rosa TaxID=992332 RepID=A0A9W7WZB7_TRIRA|nr:envelope protein [Triplophysa rosa]
MGGVFIIAVAVVLIIYGIMEKDTEDNKPKREIKVKTGHPFGVKLELIRTNGKDAIWEFDLCQVINCGKDEMSYRGYDIYGCLWPTTGRNPSGPWCHGWTDVNWSTRPGFVKRIWKMSKEHIQFKLALFRGPSNVWGTNRVNKIMIRLKDGHYARTSYITIGVDVTGTDPMGLIAITTVVAPTVPIISNFSQSGNAIASSDYTKMTPHDLLVMATGYSEDNLWLKWIETTAKEQGMADCVACARARPTLYTEPAPLFPEDTWGYGCMLGFTKRATPFNCSTLAALFPPLSNQSRIGPFTPREGKYTCFNLTSTRKSQIYVGQVPDSWCNTTVQTQGALGEWARAGLYYYCGASVLLVRVTPDMVWVCAMTRLAAPLTLIGSRVVRMTHVTPTELTARRRRHVLLKRSAFDPTINSPTCVDAIGIPRGVPDEHKFADQVATGFENIPVVSALFPVTPNKNVDIINYVHYNVMRLSNLTRDAVEGLVEQLAPTSLMAVQNRIALDMILAEKGGVCSMIGEMCCTFIPNNTAPDGSVTRALNGLKALSKEMKEHSGIDNPMDRWFNRMFGGWKGIIIPIITSLGIFLVVIVTCGCCCIPCIRSLCNRMIITAIEKKDPDHPPSYAMPLMGTEEDQMEDLEENV